MAAAMCMPEPAVGKARSTAARSDTSSDSAACVCASFQVPSCPSRRCKYKDCRSPRSPRQKLGAHYGHVSPPLSESRCTPREDAAARLSRDERDEGFLQDVLGEAPSTPRQSARSSTPRSAVTGQAVAFTDRSVRKREGLGAAAALGQEPADDGDARIARQDPNAKLLMSPAGVRSKESFANKVPICGQADRIVSPRSRVPDNLRSEKLGPAIAWESIDDEEDEEIFKAVGFSRRGKDNRGGSPGNRGPDRSVGFKHRGLEQSGSVAHGQRVSDRRCKRSVSPRMAADAAGQRPPSECGSEARSQVGSIISHGNEAPPTPRSKRKEAVYSAGLSAEADRLALKEQNHMFRYECWRAPQKSTPPSSVAESEATYDLLSPKGVPLSPKKRTEHNGPVVKRDSSTGDCINQDRMRAKQEAETNARLQNEVPFADLVARTREQAKVSRDEMRAVKHRNGGQNSSQAASILQWQT